MQINFLIFFYFLSFVLIIPVLILGSFLKPRKESPPTLEQISTNIQQDRFKQAFKLFEKYFLNPPPNQQKLWLQTIQEFISSSHFDTKRIPSWIQKLQEKNPDLSQEITSIKAKT